MNVNVVPEPYVRPSINITSIQVRVINLNLFQSVNVSVTLLSNNDYVDSKSYTLEGDDYTNWGNDDTYIVNYVLNQLGLTQSGSDVIDPVVIDPVVIDPVVIDPVVIDPVVTEPDVIDPDVTDPVVTDVTDPVVTDVTDPVVTDVTEVTEVTDVTDVTDPSIDASV